LHPRRRPADVLLAASSLRGRIPGGQARMVGGGPGAIRVRELHHRLGLRDTVVFLGEIERMTLAVEYVSAHCFCLPTVQEGFGIVFAEAMAAGLPVVACRAAAVPEIVEDSRTGLLVSPGSPDEVAMAMEKLLVNEGLRKDFGAAGARRVEAFDLERVAQRFLEILP